MPAQYESTSALLLLFTLTRTLVANRAIEKLDLLAELSRIEQSWPTQCALEVRELIQNLPDR